MAKKKAKISTLGLVLMLVAIVGAVMAVVGLFVSWFAGSVTVAFAGTSTEYYGLFNDFKIPEGAEVFPQILVQIFGIAGAALAVVSVAVMLLNTFNIAKIGGLTKLIVTAATIACGVLAIIFAGSFVGSLGSIDVGVIATGFSIAFGVFFTGIGSIAAGAAALLKR